MCFVGALCSLSSSFSICSKQSAPQLEVETSLTPRNRPLQLRQHPLPSLKPPRHAQRRTLNMSREGFCRNARGNYPTKILGEFCGRFLGGFLGAFFLEKKTGEIFPRKIHGKTQVRIWEFRGQNPHCRDLALTI